MKSKPAAFKNPFDLIEDDEEPLSTTAYESKRYTPPTYNVHTPLPFNPYQISKETNTQKYQKKTVQMIPSNKYPVQPQTNSNTNMSSPFGLPQKNPSQQTSSNYPPQQQKLPRIYLDSQLDENGDPPLLEDIGIEPQKIKQRIRMVIQLKQPTYDMIRNPDLSGPIIIGMTLGCLLLLAGKIHFGDIYAMFILGNLLIYFLLNFISQNQIIPLYSIMSTLGYGLLPMLGLGVVGIFFSLNGGIGIIVALGTAFWSSFAAGNFMQVLIKDTKDKKALLIYPLFLFYVSFTMMVVF